MKTDALGNIVWFKTYYNNASTQVVTTSFQETSDGGFILTGYSYSAHHSIFLIKTDANGNLIFDKNYNYNGDDIFGNYVIQTSDGNYVVTGYIDIAGDGPLFLMKVDTMGNLLWQKSIGGLYSDWGYCVRQTNDGGFIIAGITYAYALPGGVTDQIYLVKTDNNGTLQWSRKMGCMGNDDGYSVIQTNDNGYLITGTTTGCAPIGFEEHNIFLIKTDSSGAEQWSKLYGTGGNSSEYGYDVIRTTDEGYIVVGNTNGPNNDNNQIYVIKTDSNGNSGCNEISFPISDSTYISFDSIININVVQANLIAGSETIKIYRGCKTTALCTSEGINEYSNEKFLTISPNPFTSLTTIYFSTEQTNTTIKITDILGKEIKALNFTGKLCTLEKGTMQAGIYFVQITDANKNVVNRKVVVQ